MKTWKFRAKTAQEVHDFTFYDLKDISGDVVGLSERWFAIFENYMRIKGAQRFIIEELSDPEGNEKSEEDYMVMMLRFMGMPMGFLMKFSEMGADVVAVWPQALAEYLKDDPKSATLLISNLFTRPERVSTLIIGVTRSFEKSIKE
ncbi:MAG: hypothetical protein ACTSXJ_09885 [Candidatus Baldrarchaeia archaeon]